MVRMWKYGVSMHLPEGKRAGYYAQIVKSLAEAVDVFDRDKELIVIDTIEERDKVVEVLTKYNVEWEGLTLFHLPERADRDPRADDYGFVSKFGNAYLYGDRTAVFRLAATQSAGAETAPAIQQIQEFLLASYVPEDGGLVGCVEPHVQETIEGIASRYGVTLVFD
ncbi:hypothetical protein MO973_05725 [Paenibacillus sp. TRM 82003]|nr:hypothetical protein [Paenibacillus sp. TRM 82003]